MDYKRLYALVDVESTGTDFINDTIFDVCMLITDGEEILDKYSTAIRIEESKIDKAISNIGHIVNIDKDAILKAPSVEVFVKTFTEFFMKWKQKADKMFIVAHGLPLDYAMILYTMGRTCQKSTDLYKQIFEKNKIDTYVLARKLYPGSSTYSLSGLVKNLKLAEDLYDQRVKEKHSAELDCYILFALFKHLCSGLPML